jgi:hypothetical protein
VLHLEGLEHGLGAPDVVRMLMGDPEKIDRGVTKFGCQGVHHVLVRSLGPRPRVARDHQDVLATGEIHENRESLSDVDEVDGEPDRHVKVSSITPLSIPPPPFSAAC